MDSSNTAPTAPLRCYTVALSQIVGEEEGELICDSPTQQAHTTPSQHWRQGHNDTVVSSDTHSDTHSDSTENSKIAGDVSDSSSDNSDVSDPPTSSTSSAENPERSRSVEMLCSSNHTPITSAVSQVIPLTSRIELSSSSNPLTSAPPKHREPIEPIAQINPIVPINQIPIIRCNSCGSQTQHRVQRHRHCIYTDRHKHLQVLKRRGCKRHAFWSQILDEGYKLVAGGPGTDTMGTPAFLMTECPCTTKL